MPVAGARLLLKFRRHPEIKYQENAFLRMRVAGAHLLLCAHPPQPAHLCTRQGPPPDPRP
eukprot:1516958-Rhodomonas_salina.2